MYFSIPSSFTENIFVNADFPHIKTFVIDIVTYRTHEFNKFGSESVFKYEIQIMSVS